MVALVGGVAGERGRILSGLLAENSGGKVTVLDAKGVRTPLREGEVESMKRADTSLMPEGLERDLTPQDVADLIELIRGGPRPQTK